MDHIGALCVLGAAPDATGAPEAAEAPHAARLSAPPAPRGASPRSSPAARATFASACQPSPGQSTTPRAAATQPAQTTAPPAPAQRGQPVSSYTAAAAAAASPALPPPSYAGRRPHPTQRSAASTSPNPPALSIPTPGVPGARAPRAPFRKLLGEERKNTCKMILMMNTPPPPTHTRAPKPASDHLNNLAHGGREALLRQCVPQHRRVRGEAAHPAGSSHQSARSGMSVCCACPPQRTCRRARHPLTAAAWHRPFNRD